MDLEAMVYIRRTQINSSQSPVEQGRRTQELGYWNQSTRKGQGRDHLRNTTLICISPPSMAWLMRGAAEDLGPVACLRFFRPD